MKKIFSFLTIVLMFLSACDPGRTNWEIAQEDDLGVQYYAEVTILKGQLIEKEAFKENRILFRVSDESLDSLPMNITEREFHLLESVITPHKKIHEEMIININQISIMTEGYPSLGLTDSSN